MDNVFINHRPGANTGLPADEADGLTSLVRDLIVAVISVAAVLTIVTHIAQIIGLSFRAYAVIGLCISLVTVALMLLTAASRNALKSLTAAALHNRVAAAALLACCLMGSMLSLACYRPHSDDCHYVPNAVYHLEHPAEPMGFKVHNVDSCDDEPFVSYHYGSIPFEYSQAIVAYVLRIHFLSVYHVLGPAFFGFLIPLGWFYVITRFSFPERAAAAGTFLICLSLLLMGEEVRSIGNSSFNRIFQGKVVMFSFLMPVFIGLTMDFFRSPHFSPWFRLFVTLTASVGFTTSSAVLLPMLGAVLALACCLSYVGCFRSALLHGCCYFSAFIYPLVYAATFLLFSSGQFSAVYEGLSGVHAGQRDTFAGHARYVLMGPVTNTFLVVGTVFALCFLKKSNRRFLLLWIVLLILLYLNPLSAAFLMKYVTSPAIYFKVFFLYPLPLVVGLTGAGVALLLERFALKWRLAAYAAAAVLLALGHLPGSPSSVFRQETYNTLLRRGYKVWSYSTAQTVIELDVPAGTMLALPNVSRPIGQITSKYPQVTVHWIESVLWLSQRGRADEVIHHVRASEFLGGWGQWDVEEARESLAMLVDRYKCIRSVVARESVADDQNLYDFLRPFGFTEVRSGKGLVAFIRPGSS